MVFDVDSPHAGKSEINQSTIECRNCNKDYVVENLTEEEDSFFSSKEERLQLRCFDCGCVVIEVWNDRSGKPIGDDKDQMTHNQFADLLSDLQDNLKNVMTDDEVESFSNEIEELEEKVRT